mmetsp:Transcript_154981/g.496728  ORF Transcript_154981/g.496728 Transcript_154981/m.496728 type:complete len:366 (-) Transcript_154981:450-1547(-)
MAAGAVRPSLRATNAAAVAQAATEASVAAPRVKRLGVAESCQGIHRDQMTSTVECSAALSLLKTPPRGKSTTRWPSMSCTAYTRLRKTSPRIQKLMLGGPGCRFRRHIARRSPIEKVSPTNSRRSSDVSSTVRSRPSPEKVSFRGRMLMSHGHTICPKAGPHVDNRLPGRSRRITIGCSRPGTASNEVPESRAARTESSVGPKELLALSPTCTLPRTIQNFGCAAMELTGSATPWFCEKPRRDASASTSSRSPNVRKLPSPSAERRSQRPKASRRKGPLADNSCKKVRPLALARAGYAKPNKPSKVPMFAMPLTSEALTNAWSLTHSVPKQMLSWTSEPSTWPCPYCSKVKGPGTCLEVLLSAAA